MRIRFFFPTRRRASSLIVTLLALMVLAIIVCAFMQTASVARASAKSQRDILQARQAAEAGLDIAISQLLLATGTNQAFVTGSTNFPDASSPLTVIGRENLTNAAQLMPLVSGPTNLLSGFGSTNWTGFAAYAGARTNGSPSVAIDLNTADHFIQDTASTNLFRAAWVPLTNSAGSKTNYARLAYVVLDEQARVHPLLHDGSGSTSTNAADWYTGPGDIALTNATRPLLTADEATAMRGGSNSIALSPRTLAEAFPSRAAYEAVKHLLTTQTNFTYDVIPAAFPDGGKPKYNLNDLATNSVYGATSTERAAHLATLIRSNLPRFSSRDAALRGGDESLYLNRLAANIIDYIDPDSTPTSVNRSGTMEPAGKDFLPLPVVIAERLNRTACSPYTTPATTTIDTQVFLQVWNPYTTPIVLNGSARFELIGRPQLEFGISKTEFTPYNESLALANVTIRPNEFVILTFPTVSQNFVSPTPLPETTEEEGWPHFGDTPQSTVNLRNPVFRFYYTPAGGQETLVDLSRQDADGIGGLDRDGITFSTALGKARNWYERNHLHMYSGREFVGDPRFGAMSKQHWFGSYTDGQYTTHTYWKGRQAEPDERSQDFAAFWSNRDYVPRNASVGNLAGANSVLPSAVPSSYTTADASAAIAVFRNGPMRSLGELGHIFDPAHAADNLSAPNVTVDPSLKSKVLSPFVSGGGRTLRIGQPEFTAAGSDSWNTNGRRATELLDLFTLLPKAAARGRINPNTAAPEVLEAILAGIEIDSDTALPARRLAAGDVAQAVMTNRPYSTLSDLYKILPSLATGTNYSPAFSTQNGGGTTNLATFDRVREEAFGKLLPHLAIQSRTYRVYVVGQSLDQRQNPRGTSILEAIVYLDFDAATQTFRPIVQYRQFIR